MGRFNLYNYINSTMNFFTKLTPTTDPPYKDMIEKAREDF